MVSIIIVNYHVKKDLFECLQSIYSFKQKSTFEIIVVDNDEEKALNKELKRRFPESIYIPNNNKGFGQGNNVGAKHAKGKYLFFLNPDTKFLNNTIDILVEYLKKNKDVGIAAPVLFDKKGIPYSLQGVKKLTPLNTIFSHSFIKKMFPDNKVAKSYHNENWDKKSIKEVDVVPGTAFVIRKEIFEKIGGFDEKFFLYFEEFDLCNRVKKLGWKMYMLPTAKVFHKWAVSTKKSKKNINKIFKQSRFYYFKKHFGLIAAFFTEAILRTSWKAILLTCIIVLGAFLRLVRIDETMPFIGDQGWFYLSARDMLLTGNIPLVGIESSHPWLHQGAFWTYLLAGGLWLLGFDPLAGAYVSIFVDLAAILTIYKLGAFIFSKQIGLIAAVLYSTSPLIIFNARMPYHTSPIPFFTILFVYCLYKWTHGRMYYFPLLIMILAVLYNFEIATFLLSIVVAVIFSYGFFKKQDWARKVFSIKYLILSIIAFLVSMIPMLLYDIGHGFPQTLKFLAWVGYRVLVLFGYPPLHPAEPASINTLISFLSTNYVQLVYPFNGVIALMVFIASSIYLLLKLREKDKSIILLAILNFILIIGFIVAKTPSSAYLPVMFPGIILIIALFFNWTFKNKKIKDFMIPTIFLLICFNCFYIFYVVYSKNNDSFTQRLDAARFILKEAAGKEYNIKGSGVGSEFKSFTMNYEYLTWWLGHGPSSSNESLVFTIREENGKIKIEKR